MPACALYFLLLSAPCVFACVRFGRRYEETLPLSIFALIGWQYGFGLPGCLSFGMPAALAFAAALYLLSVIWIVSNKLPASTWLPRLVSPAAVLFAVLFAIAVLCNYGRSLYHGDEFSHWAYTVKAMTLLDDFGTNAQAASLYASYPPGVSLLQYLLQKLNGLFAGKAAYSEWLLFVPYQTAAFALLLPSPERGGWRGALSLLPAAAVMLALPALLYPLFYESLFVDPLLALMCGYALFVIWRGRFDRLTCATLCAALFAMTLMKDVGVYFALLCLAALALVLWRRGGGTDRRVRAGLTACGAVAIAAAKGSWALTVAACGVPVRFSTSAPIALLPAILSGAETGWRRTAYLRYIAAFFETRVPLGARTFTMFGPTVAGWQFSVSFCALLMVCAALILWLARRKRGEAPEDAGLRYRVAAVAIGGTLLYAASMLLLYVLKFVAFEALSLYCYERYMAIPMLMLLTLIWRVAEARMQRMRVYGPAAIALIMIALTPLHAVLPYLTREAARGSAAMMEPQHVLAERVERIAGDDETVYLLAQESDGEGLALRYLLFPRIVGGGAVGTPLYEGDTWTKNVSADAWMQALAGAYDYVVIVRTDETFLTRCATAFEAPETVEAGAVYRVNAANGMLRLITDP